MRVSSLKNGSCLRVALTGGDGTDTSPFLVPSGTATTTAPATHKARWREREGAARLYVWNRNGGKIYVLGHKPMFKLQLPI